MPVPSAKIIYLTAGAAGMFCGSCMHDNALARALAQHGWDIQLVPTYTPIRTDETDVSVDHVLFGGLNVYLQQRIPFFRFIPSALDRFLDNPRLIRRVTANAIDTDAAILGDLALSMLHGTHGNQRKEVRRMSRWLKHEKPDLLIFTNLLIGGCLEQLKSDLNVPMLVTLQGDDVFLDSLHAPYRAQCMEQIKKLTRFVDGFIVHSEFFRDYMSEYFEIPLEKFHITPLGIDVRDFPPNFPPTFAAQDESRPARPHRTIGYLARLAPEKGLQNLVEAFIQLKQRSGFEDVKLRIAGWNGPPHLDFVETQWQRLKSAGLQNEFGYLGAIERPAKLELLSQLDVMCVPTDYQEPKGLYLLESMAAGVPFVAPAHGAFPELAAHSNGGVLYEPGNASALTDALAKLLTEPETQQSLAAAGHQFVHQSRNAKSMAQSTSEVIEQFLN